jgi:adenine deaminase
MKPSMSNGEKRRILSEIALGNIAPDMVIVNGTVFNAFTREFIEKQSIWIKDGWIVYVGSDYDPNRNDRT